MIKRSRLIISLIIIVCLSISSFICFKGALEELIFRQVSSWPSGRSEIFTSQLTDEQRSEFGSALQDFSKDHRFIVISQNKAQQQSGSDLYTFSIFTSSDIDQVSLNPLVILGTPVVDKALIQRVAAAGIDEYAGYGDDVSKCIASMPSIRSGAYFRVDRLGMGSTFGNSCKVVGLNQKEFNDLIDAVSSSTGASKTDLTTKMSGSSSDLSPVYMVSGGVFVILSIVFCLLMVTYALLQLKTLGVYMMLGWSKRDFIGKLFFPQVMQLLVVVPICVLGAYLILDGFTFSISVFGYACAAMIPTVCVVLISIGIAAVSLTVIKPVDAILNRYSRCGFYVLTVVAYLICLFAVFAGSQGIKEPFDMYLNNIRIHASWSQYGDWYVLGGLKVGDASPSRHDKSVFDKNMYTWYAAHEHDEGVFLAHASYYKDNTIRCYLPDGPCPKPFWYLAASPSYLKHVGIKVSDADIAKAESGVRVYLLPKSLNAFETNASKQFLRKFPRCWESNITTKFMENPQYEFSSYDGSQQLFTWSTDAQQPITANNFVIAVMTANNMVPFESESLTATGGLQSSYVKLNKEGASTRLDDKGMVSLDQGHYKAQFVTVTNYIDNIQKTLGYMFILFSVVLVMMVATLVVMLVCFINVVNKMRAREIGVKYVLGFSARDMYGREILFVNLTILGGIIVSGILGNSIAMLVGALLLVISNSVIWYVVRKNSVGTILEIVSKEQ